MASKRFFCSAKKWAAATRLFAALLCTLSPWEIVAREAPSSDYPCQRSRCSLYLKSDYLNWTIRRSPKVIPLVIEQHVENGPYSAVLGGKRGKSSWHSGGRATLGAKLPTCSCLAVEASYFQLEGCSSHSSVSSNDSGEPPLRVPYFNAATREPDSTALATPGLYRGSASLKISDNLKGAEGNLLLSTAKMPALHLLAGARYLHFGESLTFSTNSPLVEVLTVYNNRDHFSAKNDFYGLQAGGRIDCCSSSLFFSACGKVALGAMVGGAKIDGRFKTNEFTGSVETFPGGYFALPTNIGSKSKSRIALVTELSLSIGRYLRKNLSLQAGYSLLAATSLLRASNLMSKCVNPTQSVNIEFNRDAALEGPPQPKAKLKSTWLSAQGVNVGVAFYF